jgi:hypothetical protein
MDRAKAREPGQNAPIAKSAGVIQMAGRPDEPPPGDLIL